MQHRTRIHHNLMFLILTFELATIATLSPSSSWIEDSSRFILYLDTTISKFLFLWDMESSTLINVVNSLFNLETSFLNKEFFFFDTCYLFASSCTWFACSTLRATITSFASFACGWLPKYQFLGPSLWLQNMV